MVSKNNDWKWYSLIFSTYQRHTQYYRGYAITRRIYTAQLNNSHVPPLFSMIDSYEISSRSTHRNNLLAALTQCIIGQYAGLAPAFIEKQIGCFDWWKWFLVDMEMKMSGLNNIVENKSDTSYRYLQQTIEEINMVNNARIYSPAALLNSPLRMFVQSFGRIFGQTQL